MSPTLRPPLLRHPLAAWLGQQLAVIAILTGLVTLGSVLIFKQRLLPTFIYTGCITVFCSFFVQFIKMLLTRWVQRHLTPEERAACGDWPGWPLMLLSLLLGTALGYSSGVEVGNWITGFTATGLHNSSLRRALSVMLVSLVPGLGLTFYFLAQGRLAAAEALAQTAQRQAAENQLRLLESQLEPHMLFNTLANLRVLIAMDPLRAQTMLDQLIAFLRATLSASRSGSHSLREEFARLADYLALMQVRMGERLRPVFDLPPELAEREIPPLLLQPLVENAIKHGLEPSIEGGELRVSARLDGGQLLLEVRDSGVGLAAAPASDGSHFGLHQVRERLATRYGPTARLTIAPAPSTGTLVTLQIPQP